MKNYAVILASGSGERSGLNIPKQFAVINEKTVLELTLDVFSSHKNIDEIILVTNPNYFELTNEIISKNNYYKLEKIIKGGATRQQSSYAGISAIEDTNANVLIHDAARPFVTHEIISKCINALKEYKAVNVAIESSDTIIEVTYDNIIKNVPDRKYLRRCQTPQCFDIKLIKKAHELAIKENTDNITDDCGLILRYNLADVYVVQGSTDNIKITYPMDMEIAKLILKKESR